MSRKPMTQPTPFANFIDVLTHELIAMTDAEVLECCASIALCEGAAVAVLPSSTASVQLTVVRA